MSTWVLLLFVLSGKPPVVVAVTSVPGYASFDDCKSAGKAAWEINYEIKSGCFEGPKK
jgi:hypothetical protein